MSPDHDNANDAYVFHMVGSTNHSYFSSTRVTGIYTVRPVLSLKSCVVVSGGSGTSSNPYTVELPSACGSAVN